MDKKNINIEQENNTPNIDGSRIKVFTADIQEIVKDEAILDIIKKIKSSFPFTFIEKSNIQRIINKLDNFFWIKEVNGKYILVNEKFAGAIGVRNSQLENKFEIDFIPPFQRNMFNIMNTYIIDTSNAVILEGISTPVFANLSRNEQIIQFPLLDVDNKVVAIIGLSAEKGEPEEKGSSWNMPVQLEQFKEPVLFADPKGNVLDFTGGFAEILGIDNTYKGKKLEEVFDLKFLEKFQRFIEKIDELEEHPLTLEAGSRKIKTSLTFKKNFDDSGVLRIVQITFPPITNQSQTEIKSTMYDLIMQTSPDAIFIYDIDTLKFLEVNDAAVKMYGYKRNELLNMDLTDLYAPEDIQTLIESSDSKNLSGAFTGPWRHKKKDGSSVLVEISKASLEYKGKRAHINIVRDVTEKVENSKKLQLLQAAFENSSDIILLTDNDGFITYVNDEITKHLGYSKKDLEKRPFLSLAVDSERAKVNKEIFHSGNRKPVSISLELKNYSNEPVQTTVFAKPILNFSGDIDSFILVIKREGETPQMRYENAEGGQVIDSTFLSNVFHEILTPINVILGFTQELYESISTPNSEQEEVAGIIKENQKVLMQIMDNAVEYTAIEQKAIQVKKENVRFTDIIDELKNNVRKTAEDKGLELAYGKISSSLTFETDQQRFISLVTLLLKFSVQITKEKSLYFSAYGYDNDTFFIGIRDQRSSVSPSLLKGLQEIISENENAVRKHFGFSRFSVRLLQKLIELLGGKPEVVKKGGQPVEYGIVFPINLSLKETLITRKDAEPEPEEIKPAPKKTEEKKKSKAVPVQEEEPAVEEIEEEELPKKKNGHAAGEENGKFDLSGFSCIYLEDQVDSQILFKSQMKDLKKIDCAESFEKALPLLNNNKYDFIVMDINLQGEYNGLDALRIIQKMPAYQKTPVIACTAYLLPGAKENFVAAGFRDFISKPVMRDKLTDSLKKIFS